MYNLFKMQATKKDILLTYDANTEVPGIYADQDAIHQVAVNLIGNALKFTPQGGEIKIELSKKNKNLDFQRGR